MFEIIIILAVLAAIVSGLWDLFTTEVPDQIPYAMVASGVLYWGYNWLSTGNFFPLGISLFTGTLLLGLGLLMYSKGQWGAADAWVLGGIAYMVPVYNGAVFIMPYLMNFVFVSLAYVVVYALFVGIQNRKTVFAILGKDLNKNAKLLFTIPLLLLAIILLGTLYDPRLSVMYFTVPLTLAMLVLWRYAKVIEDSVFRKKINTKHLRTGDVLEKNIWIGLTEKEVQKIKTNKKYVTVKDGIRFVPVFTITLLVTLLEINLFLMIFG